MKTINEIITELNNWTSFDPFNHPINVVLKDLPKKGLFYKIDLIDALQRSLNDENEEELETIISICFYDGVDKDFTDVFCKLLELDWHCCHEDIVLLLEEILDPKSVHCLYKTVMNVSDYFDGRSLVKKCIWTLGAINTVEAIEKLNLMLEIEDEVIKEVVTMQLNKSVKQ